MSSVKTLQKVIVLLVLLSLLGIGGVAPLCASCGPRVMDCCRIDASAFESIGSDPCCDFRIDVAPEPPPARMFSSDSVPRPERSAHGVAEMVPLQHSVADLHPEASPPRLPRSSSSPPLFLLNLSLLC